MLNAIKWKWKSSEFYIIVSVSSRVINSFADIIAAQAIPARIWNVRWRPAAAFIKKDDSWMIIKPRLRAHTKEAIMAILALAHYINCFLLPTCEDHVLVHLRKNAISDFLMSLTMKSARSIHVSLKKQTFLAASNWLWLPSQTRLG